MKCRTCDLTHHAEKEGKTPTEPYDLNDCLQNALGNIGQLQSRIRELKRDKAALYEEIDTLTDEVDDLDRKLRRLTRAVDE